MTLSPSLVSRFSDILPSQRANETNLPKVKSFDASSASSSCLDKASRFPSVPQDGLEDFFLLLFF